jgi:hypothetical protein
MVQVTGLKGGTGKAEEAKLPGAGIGPKQSRKGVARKLAGKIQSRIRGAMGGGKEV